MDAMQESLNAMEWADSDDISDAVVDYYIRKAHALAAIAQAEQLKRIADRLEAISELADGYGYLQVFKVEW